MSAKTMFTLLSLISIYGTVQAVYQLNMFFQPAVLANNQVIESCTQYIDSDLNDDYLTNCLLIDELPQWKPSQLSNTNKWNVDKININQITYTLRYRIQCHSDFYGDSCERFCKASSDPILGFYTCSSEGEKICQSGYQGSSCTEKVLQTAPITSIINEQNTSIKMPIIINYSLGMSFVLFIVFFAFAILTCLILTALYLVQRQKNTGTLPKAAITTVSEKLPCHYEECSPRYCSNPTNVESDYAEICFSTGDKFLV